MSTALNQTEFHGVYLAMKLYNVKNNSKHRAALLLCFFSGLICFTQLAVGQSAGFSIELEAGAAWQNKNDIQIPNDLSGTRFSAKDIVGEGPWASARVNGLYNFNDKHGLRVVLAPFSYSESGVTDIPVNFAGQSFQADQVLNIDYKFNSWRVGYQYNFYQRENFDMWIGVTAKVRDAEIKLQQGGIKSADDNIGFVPLLYFATEYRWNNRWSVFADLDGLAGGPGRAFDLSVKLNYDLNDDWKLGVGYRGLEGGADTDDVYNFAWFNTVLVSLTRRF